MKCEGMKEDDGHKIVPVNLSTLVKLQDNVWNYILSLRIVTLRFKGQRW